MGIAVVTTAVVIFIAEALASVLVYYCISKHQSQSSKPESSSLQQQQDVSTTNPLRQAGPEYEEVIELSENMAYTKPVQSIEMRANEAYQHVQQWFAGDIQAFTLLQTNKSHKSIQSP